MATRYQEGSIDRVRRAKGNPDVWIYRWRELQPDGTRVQRKKTIGDVNRYPNKTAAKKAVENFRAEINAQEDRIGKITVREAWGDFQKNELRSAIADRSETTIDTYLDLFGKHIIPEWGDTLLDEVETVAVERWLHSLTHLAPASRAKIRGVFSSLFSHAIRTKLYQPEYQGTRGGGTRHVFNPISMVRTSSEPVRETETLTVAEIRAIIDRIKNPAIRIMVLVAACSALRRSEIRGLKWSDLDFDRLLFRLRRGLVRQHQTKLKTRASRKDLPMLPELAEVLKQWRKESPYPADDDWVFASPFTGGERPYWPDSALVDHVRPAAIKAEITKAIGWHTFRHSVGTILNDQGEDLKTIQELLRHANPRITAEVYLHGNDDKKRAALNNVAGIFLVPAPAA
ncbi:MAG: tyrosine-type recombinase/integrase [Acidobacteriota bacterium]